MSVTALITTVAAVAALWFTGQSLRATNNQYGLAEQIAITDRFQKAAELLSADNSDTRIAALYLLERLARDSPDNHSIVFSVIASFLRSRAPVADCVNRPMPDIQIALAVIGRRDLRRDVDRINLDGTCLTGRSFNGLHLADASFRGSNLVEAILDDAVELDKADFHDANLGGAVIGYTTVLRGANFNASRLVNASISAVDMTEATFLCTTKDGVSIWEQRCTDLSGVRMECIGRYGDNGLYRTCVNLTRANLTGAIAIGARLKGTVLVDAVLGGANLSDADLTEADFAGGSLNGVLLVRAKLIRANLSRADLSAADLSGADLTGADLSGIFYTHSTRWPDGFTPPPSRAAR